MRQVFQKLGICMKCSMNNVYVLGYTIVFLITQKCKNAVLKQNHLKLSLNNDSSCFLTKFIFEWVSNLKNLKENSCSVEKIFLGCMVGF